jgi:hypothetical protein
VSEPEDDDDTELELTSDFEFDAEPEPDDGGDDVLMAIAALEAALAEGARQEIELGERCCIWCREPVADDMDHDFCEPDVPTEKMPRPVDCLQDVPLAWSDRLLCPNCNGWMPIELVAPPNAVEHRLLTAGTVSCCNVQATVTYSWSRRAVVALRYQKKPEALN